VGDLVIDTGVGDLANELCKQEVMSPTGLIEVNQRCSRNYWDGTTGYLGQTVDREVVRREEVRENLQINCVCF